MHNYYSAIKQKNLTVQDVFTLASLDEKEGVKENDRKNIAQDFFNRIKANMPLQSDISVLYALGEHKELVTYEDTAVDSPYKLYTNTGYGPGPFDNPS
ncbi:endolytic transglycosylase MltG, partial [Enterococcus faecium]|uniref:endolytic transglycosylase MltG n=1 Tax=Enterococcus faecium TaxID=1352 RepID=UPI003CC52E0D